MAEILATVVEGGEKLALEIKRDNILLVQAVLDHVELDQLINTLVEQRGCMAGVSVEASLRPKD